ncbi:MAG TPA: NUDIX domain-containing protein [Candidatus Saccharimonadales bacterium]|jgi:isopentenyldiphosphate isomerase
MNENDEILDLVDIDDNVVGTVRRGDMVKLKYRHPNGYARFAVAFLINTQGLIWVPKRSLHKSIAPGGLDFSVAEHVLAGESYAHAIQRAFREEAELNVDVSRLQVLGKLAPSQAKPSYEALLVYRDYAGGNPNYSKEEFTNGEWIAPKTLMGMLQAGVAAKSAILPALRLLLGS